MRFALVILALGLGACVTTGKRGSEGVPAVYDLGPALRAPAVVEHPLSLEVAASAWLETEGIAYRLAYAEPQRRNDYSRARGTAPPATLLRQRLVEGLGLIPAGQGKARCLLRIELEEFVHVFPTPGQSLGELRARGRVLDHRRSVLAETVWTVERPAASLDAAGGVGALAAATDEWIAKVGAWRENLMASGKLKSCGT